MQRNSFGSWRYVSTLPLVSRYPQFIQNCARSRLAHGGVTRILCLSVTERVLSWDERPWDIVKQQGKDSIRQMELMRFYLQLKQDPHGPNLALFVGNLPPNLSERIYENMLTDFLGKGWSPKEDKQKKGEISVCARRNRNILRFWFFLYLLENRFSSIGPIYYEYGSIVIIYENSDKAVRALYALRESKYEDKHLLGIFRRLPFLPPIF